MRRDEAGRAATDGGSGGASHEDGAAFDDAWPLQEPRPVQSNRRVQLPELAQEWIVDDGEDPIVHWNYDAGSNFVFISNAPAHKSDYRYADWNIVDGYPGENARIRAPGKLPDAAVERFEVEGTHVVFLASAEMLSDENPSAWVLSWTQFMRMFPEIDDGGPDEDLGELVSRNPGFMPSSPF
ncbi:hypothetical protein [Halarchaeum sp. P4]|uniref:hypothetical protein n=1 Tax=Halarchaeum sp. P4 TaxID=3421639 RepID=UPI003EB80904